MRNGIKIKIINFFLFQFILLNFLNHTEACQTTNNNRVLIEKDVMGRIIVFWIDPKDESLKVSIDQNPPEVISPLGQKCYQISCESLPTGDIVVIWMGVDESEELYSLYGTTLPSGKKWTTPVRLSDKNETIISKSHTIKGNNQDDIQIFWQTTSCVQSEEPPHDLTEKIELRNISATIKSWGQPQTLMQLR